MWVEDNIRRWKKSADEQEEKLKKSEELKELAEKLKLEQYEGELRVVLQNRITLTYKVD